MGKAIALILLIAFPALGQNYFVNSSFELPALGGITGGNIFTGWLGTNGDGITGGWTWSGTGGGGAQASGGGLTTEANWLSPQVAPDGTQMAFLLGNGVMGQTIQIPSNSLYTISFWAGTASPYYSVEGFTLQVNGVTLNTWPSSYFGGTMKLIQTNLTLAAGANSVFFIGYTNGAVAGSEGGYGINFDLVQSGPYTAGFTFNNQTRQAFTDGSYSGTENALNYVVSQAVNGWTIFIGTNGGVYDWGSQLSVATTNTITVAGSSTNNRPTIVFTNTTGLGIYLDVPSYVTLRDLIFNVGSVGPTAAIVGIDGSNNCFRVSNCEFLNAAIGSSGNPGTRFGIQVCTGHTAINTLGPFGLIDNDQFYFPGGVVYNYINTRANGTLNNWGWSNNMTWGTTNSVVIESCRASQPSPIPINGFAEGDGGARITLRYCSITNVEQSTHGPESGSGNGTVQVEQYMNQFVLNGPLQVDYWYVQRGGSAVIWSNTYVNQLVGGASTLTTTMKFWNECAGTNSSYNNFFPAGAAYNSSGFFTYAVTNNITYQFWGGIHDSQFAYGPTSGGAATATWYANLANNVVGSGTNLFVYLKGTANATVTCGLRQVDQDDWFQEGCNPRLWYPTNYPSWEQNGQGSSNNAIIYQPIYIWSNSLSASQFQSIILGHDGGDAPFIQQGRDIFTNSPMPNYLPLVFPSPQDTPFGFTNQPAAPSLLLPLGHIARQLLFH